MKKVIKKLKQSLSILLAVAMVVTCVPQTSALAFAASDTELEDTIDAEAPAEVENSAELDASADGTVLVSDNEADDPADATEQFDMEVEQSEGDVPVLDGDENEGGETDPPAEEETITVVLAEGDQPITYDGTEHKPTVTIKKGETDVTSSFGTPEYARKEATEDNKDDFTSVGSFTITVTGNDDGDYKDKTATAEYEIVAANISESYKITGVDKSYTASDELTFPATLKVVSTENESTELLADNYDVVYKRGEEATEDSKSVGEVTIVVTGKGNYKGELKTTYKIVKATTKLEDSMVTLDFDGIDLVKDTTDNAVRTGKAIEPKVIVKVSTESEPLTEGTDYTVEYENNIDGPTATVTVTAVEGGDYSGTATATFSITDERPNLADNTFTVVVDETNLKYTGEAITPKVTVTYKADDNAEAVILEENKDYTVSYSENNINAGEVVTVTVKGLSDGGYQGEKTATFTIAKADALPEVDEKLYADTTASSWSQDLSEYTFKTSDGKVVAAKGYTVGTEATDVVEGDVLDSSNKPSVTEGTTTLTYTLASNVTDETENLGKIVVNVTFDNYEGSKLNLEVVPVKKTELFFKGTSDEKVYDGQAFVYTSDKITQYVKGEDGAETEPGDDEKIDIADIAKYLNYSYAGKGNTTYAASNEAPVNAGTYEVTISLSDRCKDYKLTTPVKADLTITQKDVTVKANDRNWRLNTTIPSTTPASGEYTVTGLVGDDSINVENLVFTYKNGETTLGTTVDEWNALVAETVLTIEVSGATDNSGNYNIGYASGTLTVKPAKGAPVYNYEVTLHYNQASLQDVTIQVESGKVIYSSDEKLKPHVANYTLLGWYKDPALSKAWVFETDTVQGNVDLYAAWQADIAKSGEDGPALYLQDIPDQVYTGSKIQPTVQVYAEAVNDWSGKVLLKKGKDYTITYVNNINADVELGEEDAKGGYAEDLDDTSHGFNKNLPYIIITGKGNYAGTKAKPYVIYKNFHIEKASIGNGSLASGFTMKYTNQFVAGNKDLKPFTSLKYKKAMTLGTDYDVTITGVAKEAFTGEQDADGKDIAVAADWKTVNNGKNNKTAPVIPKGYYGKFTMTVKAKEVNYTGEVIITVIVAKDASKLLKNAKINLGKDIKTVKFADYINDDTEEVVLTVANVVDGKYYAVDNGMVSDEALADNKKCFTVSIKEGKTTKYLDATKDFSISYANNNAVGKATLTITANEESGYVGSASTTFTIKGESFKSNAKNTPIKVEGITDKPYTGSYITFNQDLTVETAATKTIGEGDDVETVPVKTFVFGEDYTVKYANNLKKGTAKITFTANPTSGYTGSFTKTFKIGQLSLMENVDVGKWVKNEETGYYEFKAATKVLAEDKKSASVTWEDNALYSMAGSGISYNLRDNEGNNLKLGTDYTAKYSNNKKVSVGETNPKKLPTLTITGKGNYTGKLVITFTIVNSSKGSLGTSVASMQMNAKKADNFEYKPKVTVKEYSGKTLAAKNNYELTYIRNTQADVKKYLDALEAGEDVSNLKPMATVKILNTSSYYTAPGENVSGDEAIAQFDATYNTLNVDLYIFKTKLTSKNCKITLTGNASQYRYTGKKLMPDIVSVTFTDAGKTINLDENSDYFVSYGANVAAGKNKGSVTIFGNGIYGGSVTQKFNINTSYIYQPKPTEKTTLSLDNCAVKLSLNGEALAKDENGKYSIEATGKQIKPSVKVTFYADGGSVTDNSLPGVVLTQNDDYVVTYGDNTDIAADGGTITITAKKNSDYYTGSFTVNFDIVESTKTALTADNCTVELFLGDEPMNKDESGYYVTATGEEIEPEVKVTLKGTDGGEDTPLVKFTDYNVSYANNKDAGTATVTISAAENSQYKGFFDVNFTIKADGEEEDTRTELTADSCNVKLTVGGKDITTEGVTVGDSAIQPDVEVTLKADGESATPLVKDTDYTVTYGENNAVGKGTVTIAAATSSTKYKGSFTVEFTINAAGGEEEGGEESN